VLIIYAFFNKTCFTLQVRDRQAIKKRSLHNERCRVFAGMTAVKFRKPMNTRNSRSQKTKGGGGGGETLHIPLSRTITLEKSI